MPVVLLSWIVEGISRNVVDESGNSIATDRDDILMLLLLFPSEIFADVGVETRAVGNDTTETDIFSKSEDTDTVCNIVGDDGTTEEMEELSPRFAEDGDKIARSEGRSSKVELLITCNDAFGADDKALLLERLLLCGVDLSKTGRDKMVSAK